MSKKYRYIQLYQEQSLGHCTCDKTDFAASELYHVFKSQPPVNNIDTGVLWLGAGPAGTNIQNFAKFIRMTYDLALEMAKRLQPLNPALTFCYVTGMHNDAKSKRNWAQVKAATENELLRLFKNAYMFRPAAMYASREQKNLKAGFRFVERVFYPLLQFFVPGWFCSLEDVGRAMIAWGQKFSY